jgi:hypothetical protein
VNLLRPNGIGSLVQTCVSQDSWTQGPISVQESAYASLCQRIVACNELLESYDPWTERQLADLIQLILTAVFSITTDPVLDPGPNTRFALTVASDLAGRNGALLDVDNCEAYFHILIDQSPTSMSDSRIADIRSLISDHLYLADEKDLEVIRLTDRNLARTTGLTAFIAPPMSGLADDLFQNLSDACDLVEGILRDNGFTEVFQPIHYCDPRSFPETCTDSSLVRVSDIDNVLSSDLVIAFVNRPATGVGIILAWAERNGSAQFLIEDRDSFFSPLPSSSRGVVGTGQFDGDLDQVLRSFLLQNRDAITNHRDQRVRRTELQGPDLNRFRDAFAQSVKRGFGKPLPGWLTITRVFEILRSVDHFAVMTDDEYRVLEESLGIETNLGGGHIVGLTAEDIDESERFAASRRLSRGAYARLLQEALSVLESAGPAVIHRRRSRDWWNRLYRGK